MSRMTQCIFIQWMSFTADFSSPLKLLISFILGDLYSDIPFLFKTSLKNWAINPPFSHPKRQDMFCLTAFACCSCAAASLLLFFPQKMLCTLKDSCLWFSSNSMLFLRKELPYSPRSKRSSLFSVRTIWIFFFSMLVSDVQHNELIHVYIVKWSQEV